LKTGLLKRVSGAVIVDDDDDWSESVDVLRWVIPKARSLFEVNLESILSG
jgi:hypothetical protein